VRKPKAKGGGLENVHQTVLKQRAAAKIPNLSAKALFWLAAHFEVPERRRRESSSGLYYRVE
jgi:hypothetical protein